VVFDARSGSTMVTGSVVPFPTVSGSQERLVYFYDKKTLAHLPFVAGSYRLTINLNGKPDKNLPFTVK